MSNLEKINPQEFGLQESQVQQIEQEFTPLFTEITAMQSIYTDFITQEITPELCEQAKRNRLKARDIRTKGIEPIHKANKAYHLAAGRYVDAWRNKYNALVVQMEDGFEKIETYYIEIEKQRLAQLKLDRLAALVPFQGVEPIGIELMSEDAWATYLQGAKAAHDARIAAEKEAERLRLEAEEKERQEREAQRLENERLKKEAAEREAQLAAERAAAAKAQAEANAKLEAEREAARKEKEEAERKIREAQDAAQKAEQERLRVEKENTETAAREAAESEAEAERVAKMGDKDRFVEMLAQLNTLIDSFEFKSKAAKAKQQKIKSLINE